MADGYAAPTRPDYFIPASEYRDPRWDQLEREKLWPRVWQMACRESDLVETGDFVAYEILDDSILIIRTGPGADDLNAMYNVCQHRGRRLVDRPKGRLGNQIACRFHGWRFDLQGELKHVTFGEDWADCPQFDKADLSIPKVRLERWGGWIWINQSEDAPPLAEWLTGVAEPLAAFGFAEMRPLWWKTIIAPVNWKIIVEAFNEGYHSGETHISGVNYRNARMPTATVDKHAMFFNAPSPFTEYRDASGKWVTPESFTENLWANQLHLYNTLGAITLDPSMRASEKARAMPADSAPEAVLAAVLEGVREELESKGASLPAGLTMETWLTAATDYHIFPNSIVLPSLDGALWYRVRPGKDGHDSAIFDIWSFGRYAPGAEPKVEQEIYHGFEAFKGQCEFLEEDFGNMEAVNTGVKSRGFRGATTNPLQEASVSHFHATLKRFCGDPAA